MNWKFGMRFIVCLCAALAVSPIPAARCQCGVSSGSVSYALATRGLRPSDRHHARGGVHLADIRVEEFINYHRHLIPMPHGDDQVRMDLRWDKIDDENAILQIGLATAQSVDLESIRPLNLVLVIDRSGSMSGDRIANVTKAIRALVKKLRDEDMITIVTFSDEAEIALSGYRPIDRADIDKAIDRIEANGSTNLHAGLMLGYEQAKEHFSAKKTNRVILLTDGLANRGTTDEGEIAEDSREFNQEGIDLATIGLGDNFNETLLRKLADAGRGLMHFVADGRDIQKTFENEVESLLAPVARQVQLSIDFGNADRDVEIYGYNPVFRDETAKLKLMDLNLGATQVVLARVRMPKRNATARVRLSYVNAVTQEPCEDIKSVELDPDRLEEQSSLSDADVRKNFVIAKLASAINKCVADADEGEFKAASHKLVSAKGFARNHFEKGQDPDVERIVEVASAYQEQVDSASRHCLDE